MASRRASAAAASIFWILFRHGKSWSFSGPYDTASIAFTFLRLPPRYQDELCVHSIVDTDDMLSTQDEIMNHVVHRVACIAMPHDIHPYYVRLSLSLLLDSG